MTSRHLHAKKSALNIARCIPIQGLLSSSLQSGVHHNHTRQERAVTSPSRLYAGFQPSVAAAWRTQLSRVSSVCRSRPQINSNRQTEPVLRYHWVTPCGSAEIYTQSTGGGSNNSVFGVRAQRGEQKANGCRESPLSPLNGSDEAENVE